MSFRSPRTTQEINNRIYRVIRACPDSWTAKEIASLAECGIERTRETIWVLESQGYVREAGRRGQVKLWRMTSLGRNSPTPPERPRNREDFTAERRALARLCEMFLAKELSNWRVADNVKAQLEILNRRFGGTSPAGMEKGDE